MGWGGTLVSFKHWLKIRHGVHFGYPRKEPSRPSVGPLSKLFDSLPDSYTSSGWAKPRQTVPISLSPQKKPPKTGRAGRITGRQDHYGLEDVKERILEHIAVSFLKAVSREKLELSCE